MHTFRVELGRDAHPVHVGAGTLDQTGRLARKAGLAVTAYCAMAVGRVLTDPTIAEIADSHGRTIPQIVLRWLVQQDAGAVVQGQELYRHGSPVASRGRAQGRPGGVISPRSGGAAWSPRKGGCKDRLRGRFPPSRHWLSIP